MTNSSIDPNPTNNALIASLIDARPAFADELRRSRAAQLAFTAIDALDDDDDDTLDAMRNMMTDRLDDLMTLDPDPSLARSRRIQPRSRSARTDHDRHR
jgi:hypothetical protein